MSADTSRIEHLSWPPNYLPTLHLRHEIPLENRRVILIVLDALGCGQTSSAREYEDISANTLRSVLDGADFEYPMLTKMGLGNIFSHEKLKQVENPLSSVGIMSSASAGKDTTAGHWELAGHLKSQPFPTYPKGFPDDLMEKFSSLCGRGYLGNTVASGTHIIDELGREHVTSGDVIVYTSADSVFQIAAHEEVVSLSELYGICQRTRDELLVGEHAVGRVIARPFLGNPEEGFYRTSHRHDYSLEPQASDETKFATILEGLTDSGKDVISVGKIFDIFAGKGFSQSFPTSSNQEGMQKISKLTEAGEGDLVFANLVDFDMVYGHRRDTEGFARALKEFDTWLTDYIETLQEGDLLLITADHGCDPTFIGTDHTDEDVFVLAYSPSVSPVQLTREHPFPSFLQVSQIISDWLDFPFSPSHDEIPLTLFTAKIPDITEISSRLSETLPHHNFYLVGGAVRDLLSGNTITDIDFAFKGDYRSAIQALSDSSVFAIEKTNPEFGTARIIYKNVSFDISSFRSEQYDDKSHYPQSSSLQLNVDLQVDSFRRDYTLNSLYLDLQGMQLIDLYGGFIDLCQSNLKSMHRNSFIDDPTRIIRGLKFCNRFNYFFENQTALDIGQVLQNDQNLKKLSVHKREELNRLLSI